MLIIRPPRRFWLVGGIALMLIGCGTTSMPQQSVVGTSFAPTKQPSKFITPTISTAPGTGFAWQPLSGLPTTDLVFAPSDGNVGYGCAEQGNTETMLAWATHDRGAHFAPTTAVPAVPGGFECNMLVDDNNANIAVIKVSGSFPSTPFVATPHGAGIPRSSPGPSEVSDLITLDAGLHWHLLPNNVVIYYLASVGSRIYAFIGTDPHWAGEPLVRTDRFVVSDNGMQSWQQRTLPAANGAAFAARTAGSRSADITLRPANGRAGWYPEFFGDPFSGDLLYIGDSFRLMRSSDGGNSWATVATPAVIQQIVFSIPSTQHTWTMCFTNNTAIWCSANIGRSWQPHTYSDFISFDESNYGAVLVGIATNGDLIALNGSSVESLAASANQWQILGTVPGVAGIEGIYGPAQGNVLWAIYGATSQWYAASYPVAST